MKDIDFYRICLRVLDELCKKSPIPEKEFKKMTGFYYKDVVFELKDKEAIFHVGGYGDYEIGRNTKDLLESRFYEKRIKELEDEAYRIKLDNESKEATIKSARTAKWAFWLSILSLTGVVQDLIAWIWKLVSDAVHYLI